MEEVPVIIRGIGSFTYLCNGSDVFIQFFVYLCHVIDDFASLELQHEGK